MKKIQEHELTLVPIADLHGKYIYKYLNNPQLLDTYPITYPYTEEDSARYISQEVRGKKNNSRHAFAIMLREEFVGISALYDVNQFKKQAKLYYWVAVEFWNRGIGTKALQRLMDFAKKELKITELRTGVLKRNIGSVKVLEKNGFVVERTLINQTEYHSKFTGEQFLEMKATIKTNKD